MGPITLTVKNLFKEYPNGTKALNGINLEVQPGEFIAVIGGSGSGKSTFLRCLNGLTEATRGEIIFDQQVVPSEIMKRTPLTRKKVATIFQQFNLIGRHSVMSNVLMGQLASTSTFASLLGRFDRDAIESAQRCLRLVGISEKMDVRTDQLSGGQQQRVAIARALIQEPDILLADEPVASLDPVTSQTVMGYLRKINQELGLTVICNLHSIGLARKFAGRVVGLKAGRIAFDGPTSQLSNEIVDQIYGESASEATSLRASL